jgi:two-component sensor histidine kinase
MTGPDVGLRDLLEALPEPSLILETTARIRMANRAAAARFGAALGEQPLTVLAPGETAAALRMYLARCSGSRGPLPGAILLRERGGAISRFRCSGSLLVPARDAPAVVFLRLSDANDERFSALGEKVRVLNSEIRERRRTQAVLEEALRERELMLRELHHRVKNSIQMLVAMVAAARREAEAPAARTVLDDAARRLAAVGAVHQLLYRTERLESLQGDRFLAELSATILRGYGAEARLTIAGATSAAIPNDAAVPLALILNELLTNALKHGARDGEIRVALSRVETMFELSVEDDGPGFEPSASTRRASGLGLVRGLARQLGGSFVVERDRLRGARCTVRFRCSEGDVAAYGSA